MLRIKEHMTFILAALVFTIFSLPAQAGVSIRIGTLSYGQNYGYGFSSGTNYYGPSSYYDHSSEYSRHNNHRNNYYNKHSPGTHVYGSYPINSYKYRNQNRPLFSSNFENSYRRGYEQGFTDASNTRHRGNGIATKKSRKLH